MTRKEKEKIVQLLKKQFGIQEVQGLIVQRGEERLFLYQGSLTAPEIWELEKTIPIERVGTYFAKLIPGENEIRLSIEGTHILKDQITENILELTEEQAKKYLKGEELYFDEINYLSSKSENEIANEPEKFTRGFKVIKFKEDFWGCGKVSEKKISNFIPKNRRVKEKAVKQ